MEDNNTNNLTNNENNNLIGGKKGGFNPYEIRLRARLGAKRRGYSDDTINDIYPSLGGYNKDTYIGYLKLKNGGMKIVEGDEDNKIIEERNTILKHLVETINKTLPLMNEYLILYAKALEGKYIRNHICKLDNNDDCKNEIETVKKISKKLIKKALQLKMYNILSIYKEHAPKLTNAMQKKIKKLLRKNNIRNNNDIDYEITGGIEDLENVDEKIYEYIKENYDNKHNQECNSSDISNFYKTLINAQDYILKEFKSKEIIVTNESDKIIETKSESRRAKLNSYFTNFVYKKPYGNDNIYKYLFNKNICVRNSLELDYVIVAFNAIYFVNVCRAYGNDDEIVCNEPITDGSISDDTINYFLDFIYAQQCTDVGKNLLNKLKFYGKHIMTNKKVIYNIEEYFDPIKYSHIFNGEDECETFLSKEQINRRSQRSVKQLTNKFDKPIKQRGGAILNNIRKKLNRRELIDLSTNKLYSEQELNTISLVDKRNIQTDLFEKLCRCKNKQIGGSINYPYFEEKILDNNEIELSPEIKQLHQSYNKQIKGLQSKIKKLTCNNNSTKLLYGGSVDNSELNKLRMDINRRYSINENNTKYDLNNMSLIDKRELQHNLIDTLSRYNNIQVGGSINYNYIEEKIQPITELSPEIKQLHQSYDNQIIGLQNEINALLNN
jgi:hypothetical protein